MATYQLLREQLVELSVQLEDKNKGVELLQRQVRHLKRKADSIVDVVDEQHSRRFQELQGQVERELATEVCESNDLVERKKELLQECKAQVTAIELETNRTQEAVHNIKREHDEQLQQSLQEWRRSEDDRRRAYFAAKTREHRDNTLKALKPEMDRIRDAHRQEILRLRQHFKDRAHRTKKELMQQEEGLVASEREKVEEVFREKKARLRETMATDVQRIQLRHRKKLQDITARLRSKVDAHQQELTSAFAKSASERAREVERARVALQEALSAAREENMREIRSLRADGEKQLRDIRRQFDVDKEAISRREREAHEDERHRQHRSAQLAAEQLRDQRVEDLVRRVQEETVDFEDALKQRTEEQKQQFRKRFDGEAESIAAQQQQWKQRLTQAASERENLVGERAVLRQRAHAAKQELRDKDERIAQATQHVAALEGEVALLKQDINGELATAREHGEATIAEREATAQAIREQQASEAKRHEADLERLEKKHDEDLHALDENVKRAVFELDTTIRALKEQVATEKVKRTTLQKLLRRYGVPAPPRYAATGRHQPSVPAVVGGDDASALTAGSGITSATADAALTGHMPLPVDDSTAEFALPGDITDADGGGSSTGGVVQGVDLDVLLGRGTLTSKR